MEKPDFMVLHRGAKVEVVPYTEKAAQFLSEHDVTLPPEHAMVFDADAIEIFIADVEAAGLCYWIVSYHALLTLH
jgi:hypothetical protein